MSLVEKLNSPLALAGYRAVVLVFLVVIIILTAKSEGFSGDAPFDYGIGQRRDILLSHTGSDGRSLASKINDAITKHTEEAPKAKEGLVATNNGAPAFWDNGLYNLEGKIKGGAIDAGRNGENFDDQALVESYRERLDDSDLLRQESMGEQSIDQQLLNQDGFRGRRW